jgi:hypothetical protein
MMTTGKTRTNDRGNARPRSTAASEPIFNETDDSGGDQHAAKKSDHATNVAFCCVDGSILVNVADSSAHHVREAVIIDECLLFKNSTLIAYQPSSNPYCQKDTQIKQPSRCRQSF